MQEELEKKVLDEVQHATLQDTKMKWPFCVQYALEETYDDLKKTIAIT